MAVDKRAERGTERTYLAEVDGRGLGFFFAKLK